MVVIDQFNRRIVGLKAIKGDYTGPSVCYLFNQIIAESEKVPKYLSTDNDTVFLFDRWKINLEILGIKEIKSLPGVPTSHPYVERCIGTIRREFLDQTLFWTKDDLEQKLCHFQQYYNEAQPHQSLDGDPPFGFSYKAIGDKGTNKNGSYCFVNYCNGMFSIPLAT